MNREKLFVLTSLLFFLAIFDPQLLPAQTYSWIGTDGVFSSQFNWNPVGVPGAINPIEFNVTADIEVELTSNHSVRSIKQLGNRVTFVGGRQLSTQADSGALTNRLTFSGAGTAFQNSTTLNVGSSTLPLGEFWIRGNASAETNDIIVAPGGLDAGRLVVVDPGSNLNNSSSLTVGGGGDGILFLNVGGMLTTGTSIVADQPLSASMAIIAGSSRWETAGMLVFGNVGDADIYVEEGGIVTGGQTFIGRQNLSNSTVTVSGDGSFLQVQDLFLGTPDGPTDGGIGHLEILQLTASDATVVRVGGFNGEGSTNGLMSIADNDTAEVFVRHGSTITTGDLFVGTGIGTNGSLSISGAGSSVVAAEVCRLGGLGSPPNDGFGTLEVDDGATLIAGAGQFYNGVVNVNGAGTQLEFESLVLGLGSGEVTMILEQTTGSTDPAAVFVGDGRGTFSGSMVGVSDSTDVATLAVQAGAFLISDYGLIGEGPGNHGQVNVIGTDSGWLTRFNINVGATGGDGELVVMNGGTVSGSFMRVGNGLGSTGTVTVQGTDAIITMAGGIIVGGGGPGAMSIADDGLVEADSITIASSSSINVQRGELRANTINNGGQISLNGFGPSLITGSVINEPTGSVVIQGTDAVFSGAVENNGVGIETSFGSCTFAGGLSGTSPLTGNGTVLFQGPVQPGNGIGAINIENDVCFDSPASSIFELGGTSASQHDRLVIDGDCQLGGTLQVEIVNGHSLDAGNQYLIVEIGGNASGAFADWLEGDIVAIANGNILRISYVGGDGNDVVLIGEPGWFVVVPEVANISQGTLVSGTVSDLTQSDNADLSIQRSTTSIQAITEFTAVATSPTDQPTSLVVKLEGSVFARTPVNQFVELFDYQLNRYELIGSNTATRFTDSTIELTVSGDLSRFVQPDTKRMIARIRYQSLNSRQAFASNTDQFVWEVGL